MIYLKLHHFIFLEKVDEIAANSHWPPAHLTHMVIFLTYRFPID